MGKVKKKKKKTEVKHWRTPNHKICESVKSVPPPHQLNELNAGEKAEEVHSGRELLGSSTD